MRNVLLPTILGVLLLASQLPARAAGTSQARTATPIAIRTGTPLPLRTPPPPPPTPRKTATPIPSPTPGHGKVSSDWPSLDADAAMSDHNAGEKTLTASNVLKLKARWTTQIPDASYPIVAGGRVFLPVLGAQRRLHVRVLDAASGRQLGVFSVGSLGGMLADNGNLYVAGSTLQVLNPATGAKVAQINPSPKISGGTFLDPVADNKLVLAGYASAKHDSHASLYGIDPGFNRVIWKVPSVSGQGVIARERIFTRVVTGGVLYDETSGKTLASRPRLFTDWFAGKALAYTVTSVGRKNAAIFAVDHNGRQVWKHTVGPYMVASNWPHAVNGTGLYLQVLHPFRGLEALNPVSGKVLWSRQIPDIERLALANGLLYILAYSLGQPVRLIVLRAKDGGFIGGIVLSRGYYAFSSLNGLMVANGMVFIRAVGPSGSQLVALGL